MQEVSKISREEKIKRLEKQILATAEKNREGVHYAPGGVLICDGKLGLPSH